MEPIIAGLLDPAHYDHATGPISVRQTHISWILLAGDYAYKIKKPVNFGFLDFSTLEKRRFYCAEEVRLNRRLAADLYLDVVPITGSPAQPRMNGRGRAFEYAVKMRRFDNECLFDRLVEENRLDTRHIDALADEIADFHRRAKQSCTSDQHGVPENIHATVLENFDQIAPSLDKRKTRSKLAALKEWCEEEFERVRTIMRSRKANGFIRECHGDLHLGNIVLIDNRPTLFDCIEFSEKLRWVDAISEIAFIVMDLTARKRPDLSFRLLNRYLSNTGDYAGLRLFRYYLVYRAVVRAKIAVLSITDAEDREVAALTERFKTYIELAAIFTGPTKPALAITHGLSGSGKSLLAGKLSEHMQAIWLRSDVERKRLAGYAANADSRSDIGASIYTDEMSRTTYAHLAEMAALLLRSSFSVIVDAAFLKRWQREALRKIAKKCGVPFLILDLHAPLEALQDRIRHRCREKTDPSEANLAVLEHQRHHCEPLDTEERHLTFGVDSTTLLNGTEVLESIKRTLFARR